MKIFFKKSLWTLLPVLMLAACSDDEKPEPAPGGTAIEKVIKELEEMSEVKDFTAALKQQASSLNIADEKLTVLAAKDFDVSARSVNDKDVKRHILKEVYDFSAMTSDTLMVKTIAGEELYVTKSAGNILVNGIPLVSVQKTQVGESVVYIISTAIPSTVEYVKPKHTITFTVLECNEEWTPEDNRPTYPSQGTMITLYREIDSEFVPVDSVKTDAQGKAVYQHNYADGVFYTAAKGEKSHLYDGYLPQGVFTSQEEIENSPQYHTGWENIDNKKPGTLILADINGDAVINNDDRFVSEYMTLDADEEVEFYLAWEIIPAEVKEDNFWTSLETFKEFMASTDNLFLSFVQTNYIIDYRLVSAEVTYPGLQDLYQANELWEMGYKYIRSFYTTNQKIYEVNSKEFMELWQSGQYSAKLAYVYATMVNYWGDVPLITGVLSAAEDFVPRAPKLEIMVYLESMIQNVSVPEANVIRILLARYYANEKNYQKANLFAEQVYNESNDDEKYIHPVRYSEVILILAESYMELGDLNKALQYVNMINVKNDQSQTSVFSSLDEARNKIRELWREEFANEGLSYMLINRWGLLIETLGDKGAHIHNNLLPIPWVQMAVNPKLIQNPGY